jgi:hypothetical protein
MHYGKPFFEISPLWLQIPKFQFSLVTLNLGTAYEAAGTRIAIQIEEPRFAELAQWCETLNFLALWQASP